MWNYQAHESNRKIIMTDINNEAGNSSVRKRAGVKRMIKQHLKIDMTPMVDLGFLLISFFVITTELSRPRSMNLYMPADGPPMATAESKTITFLSGANDKLFYYYGEETDAGTKNPVTPVSWTGENSIGHIISEKQMQLDNHNGGRDQLVVIIKPGKETSYRNVVDILDEMIIHDVKRYAVVQQGENDQLFLRSITQ